MNTMNKVKALGRDVRGLSTVEYVLLLVLIAAGSIGAWKKFGEGIVKKVDKTTGDIAKL